MRSRIVAEFPIPVADAEPGPLGLAPDGSLWFVGWRSGQVYRVSVAGSITPYAVRGAGPERDHIAIAAGGDGSMWFVRGAYSLARITSAGQLTVYPLGNGNPVRYLVSAPDGRVWFLEHDPSRVGNVGADGITLEYTIPTPHSWPRDLVVAKDGSLWFAEYNAARVGHVEASGTIHEFQLDQGVRPRGLAAASDGGVWFSEGTAIGRITPDGQALSYPLKDAMPVSLVSDVVGSVWFGDNWDHMIRRISSRGALSEFPLTSTDPDGVARNLILGPEGAIWFTMIGPSTQHATYIGRIDRDGSVSLLELGPGRNVISLLLGSDGMVWFTDAETNTVGRVRPNWDGAGE